MQKIFFEMMKQFQGEYMGSMLSALFESMGGAVRPDADEDLMLDSIFGGTAGQGLGDAVKDNDSKFPPDSRLSKTARAAKTPNRRATC